MKKTAIPSSAALWKSGCKRVHVSAYRSEKADGGAVPGLTDFFSDVEYSLTERGKPPIPILDGMCAWGGQNRL